MAAKNRFRLVNNTKAVALQIERKSQKNMIKAMTLWRSSLMEVLSGTRSGNQYKVPFTAQTYTASAPGQAPAVRTGALKASYKIQISGNGLAGRLNSTLAYAAHLEYGTYKMEPRPHLVPAFNRVRSRIEQIMSEIE